MIGVRTKEHQAPDRRGRQALALLSGVISSHMLTPEVIEVWDLISILFDLISRLVVLSLAFSR